jgi:hypothetical protein
MVIRLFFSLSEIFGRSNRVGVFFFPFKKYVKKKRRTKRRTKNPPASEVSF